MRRWLVPGFFLVAAVAIGAHAWDAVVIAAGHATARHVLLAQYAVLRTAVALAFALFTVQRAQPHRRARDPRAFVACTVAMLAIVVVAPPAQGTPIGLLITGDVVAVCGCIVILASVLVLGRCFGVLPEARGLVRRGPYRLVRHPVYFGEIAALAGLTLAAPVPRNLVLVAAFIAAQVVRARFEEQALTDAFPEYQHYMETTGRLFPPLRRWSATVAAPESVS
jgi:protein-S-isoprenylcysteine O-methyltransferase Ste14